MPVGQDSLAVGTVSFGAFKQCRLVKLFTFKMALRGAKKMPKAVMV